MWSCWKMRNESIFQQKEISWVELTQLIKSRIAWWVITKWAGGNLNSYFSNSANPSVYNPIQPVHIV
ncbi:hypothetical protein RHMOL_Rhmol04G0295800 [Rhododendron molle]|uniref:Uncharacterized protein n=1 Tax=Rhododendron molle TaxID=49168 RepID=A0ACC0P5S0_RHOML|nr:hypothetical protein RHMOL_Rhmol04G0295800 [Rhododendron molle]